MSESRDWFDENHPDAVTWRLVLADGEVVTVKAMPWLMEGYSCADADHGGHHFHAECRYDDSIDDLGEVVGHLAADMLRSQREVREIVPPGGQTAVERAASVRDRCVAACDAVGDARHDLGRYVHEPECIHDTIGRGSCADCDDTMACADAVRRMAL